MKRSWSSTVGWVVASLVLAGIATGFGSCALSAEETTTTVLGWVCVAVFALLMLVTGYLAIFSSDAVACPRCGGNIAGFEGRSDEEQFGLCGKCKSYVHVHRRQTQLLPDGFVSPKFIFKAEVKGEFRWPNGCMSCGAPPVRTCEIATDVSNTGSNLAASAAGLALFAVTGAGFVRYGGGGRVTLQVPCCAQHEGGVRIDEVSSDRLTLAFYSLAAHRAFFQVNPQAEIPLGTSGRLDP